MTRLRGCDQAVIDGRLAKARQFLQAAELVLDFTDDEAGVGDAYVTLCVHAGIAAADVICCVELGTYTLGDNHEQAKEHLARVKPDGADLARALGRLLSVKTRAGYQYQPVTAAIRTRAGRAANQLMRGANDRQHRRHR